MKAVDDQITMSLFVTCDDEPEINRLFASPADDGMVLIPLGAYPFAARYAWVQDRFGVSWQLTLAEASPET